MPPSADKKYLLLDSCIAEYLLDRYMSEVISQQIDIWANQIFELAISEISYAELIHGAVKEKIEKVKSLLKNYSQIEVSQRVLSGAGVLGNIYSSKEVTHGDMGLADRIIAATSIVYNLPIVTANVRDFPHPFFISIQSKNVKYRKKNKDHYLALEVLKPNYELINFWYTRTS